MHFYLWLSALTLGIAVGDVLDLALYLSPSPPLTDTSDSVPSGELWTRRYTNARTERDTSDLTSTYAKSTAKRTTTSLESMESAETFWPFTRSSYVHKAINVPVTFSLAGTYGGYGSGSGIIGNTYASITGIGSGLLSNVKTLAGTGYGTYSSTYGSGYGGSRIFGRNTAPSWSGWGNGKWGHYGKG